MPAPGSHPVYLDALRPPAGFAPDRAVGTTCSLDLETLLAVPLGFAMLDRENEQGALARDPVALLHALRQRADRVIVFCEAGRMTWFTPLVTWLAPAGHGQSGCAKPEGNAPASRRGRAKVSGRDLRVYWIVNRKLFEMLATPEGAVPFTVTNAV